MQKPCRRILETLKHFTHKRLDGIILGGRQNRHAESAAGGPLPTDEAREGGNPIVQTSRGTSYRRRAEDGRAGFDRSGKQGHLSGNQRLRQRADRSERYAPYIAQVKQKCGIIERACYNKPKSENAKQPQCPPEKKKVIREALEHFQR